MKKVLASIFAASLMLLSINANAQLSAVGGYLNATENTTYTNGNTKKTSKAGLNGFYVGGTYALPIPGVNGLGALAGVNASFLFGKYHSDGFFGLGANTTNTTEIALNFPINVTYAYELTGDTKLFAFAGPTLQYALSYKDVVTLDSDTSTSTTYNRLSGDYANRNPFNLYIGGGIGAQVAGIQITVGYDQSLLNFCSKENYSGNRGVLKIGVGYAF